MPAAGNVRKKRDCLHGMRTDCTLLTKGTGTPAECDDREGSWHLSATQAPGFNRL